MKDKTKEVDKTILQSAINLAAIKNEREYTEASWAVMQDKLAVANVVNKNAEALQDAVNTAASELNAAILKLKPNSGNGNIIEFVSELCNNRTSEDDPVILALVAALGEEGLKKLKEMQSEDERNEYIKQLEAQIEDIFGNILEFGKEASLGISYSLKKRGKARKRSDGNAQQQQFRQSMEYNKDNEKERENG